MWGVAGFVRPANRTARDMAFCTTVSWWGVAVVDPGDGVDVEARGREHELPGPLGGGADVLLGESERQGGAAPDAKVVPLEVDVLDPQGEVLEEAQAGAIEKDAHEPRDAAHLPDDGADLGAGEDDRQSLGSLRAVEGRIGRKARGKTCHRPRPACPFR